MSESQSARDALTKEEILTSAGRRRLRFRWFPPTVAAGHPEPFSGESVSKITLPRAHDFSRAECQLVQVTPG